MLTTQSWLRPVIQLLSGDLASRAVSLLTFMYVVRVVGADRFGTLEFAVSALTYFLLLGDCGLEMWAVRAVAVGESVERIAGRVIALRLLLSLTAYLLLAAVTPLMPDYPNLSIALPMFGVALLPAALNLKWVFVGRQQMPKAAAGLLLGQIAFAVAVLAAVRGPEDMLWVPAARVVSEAAATLYFGTLYLREYPLPRLGLLGASKMMHGALAVGAVQAIGLLSYNFDMLMIGFLRTAAEVGLYSAAYKPVTVALALPLAGFSALFPGFARSHAQGKEELRALVHRSLKLTSMLALPIGVGGMLLAEPVVVTLFGAPYAQSARALEILCWSAVLVTIRSNFNKALTASGQFGADLKSSSTAILVNIGLNLLLIPRWGAQGAAAATVVSDSVWLFLAALLFHRRIGPAGMWSALAKPVAAAVVMAVCVVALATLPPIQRGSAGLIAYAITLALLHPIGERQGERADVCAVKDISW